MSSETPPSSEISGHHNEVPLKQDIAGPADEIDRSPPIGVLLSAEVFFKAAQHLHKATQSKELRLRFDMPIYYLYCHALELTLKSFLRTKEITTDTLRSREFGHKLQNL